MDDTPAAPPPTHLLPIIIIGAGIGGLTLAQALLRHKIAFHVYERQPRAHQRQGHRFRISEEAFAALRRALGPEVADLLVRTAPVQAQPNTVLRYPDARLFQFDAYPSDSASITTTTATDISNSNSNSNSNSKPPSAPRARSTPIDRAWIRAVLETGLDAHMSHGKELASYRVQPAEPGSSSSSVVSVTFTDGSTARGALLVGADGIRSRVRRQLQPTRHLLDLNRVITWGRTPLTTALREALPAEALSWFLAADREADAQGVFEAITWGEGGRHTASTAPMITTTTGSKEESKAKALDSLRARFDFSDYIYWAIATAPPHEGRPLPHTGPERREMMARISAAWHPQLRMILDAADYELSACIPVISSKPDIELPIAHDALPASGPALGGGGSNDDDNNNDRNNNNNNMVTILGDAAHAMSPMGQAGGDLAIRDAIDLAALIVERGLKAETVRAFEEIMAARARKHLERAFANGKKYWTHDAYREVRL